MKIEDQPVIILVKPQLAQNFGAVARSMLNFSFKELRIVSPKFDLSDEKILPIAAGADEIILNCKKFNKLEQAIEDLNYLAAFTARNRSFNKKFFKFPEGVKEIKKKKKIGYKIGIIFGPENSGLSNQDLSLAEIAINIDTNPKYTSLNLSHAVILFCYEWEKQFKKKSKHYGKKSQSAQKKDLINFLNILVNLLNKSGFFKTEDRKNITILKLKNIFNKMELTHNELQMLIGLVNSLYKKK